MGTVAAVRVAVAPDLAADRRWRTPNCSAILRTVILAASRSAIWIRSRSERYRGLRGLASVIFTGA